MTRLANLWRRLIASRTICVLLQLAFLLGACALAEAGRSGGPAEAAMLAGYEQIRVSIDGQPGLPALEGRQVEEGAFDTVTASSCRAGDVFGCGLFFTWRALVVVFTVFEKLVTLAMIGLFLPWLVWAGWREAIATWRNATKKNASLPAKRPRWIVTGSATPRIAGWTAAPPDRNLQQP